MHAWQAWGAGMGCSNAGTRWAVHVAVYFYHRLQLLKEKSN